MSKIETNKKIDEINDSIPDSTHSTTPSIPKLVFIVPYRDREPQRFFFQNYMTYLMEDLSEGVDYLLFFVEQMDSRPFNRGAMKNIGFIAVKSLYPDDYKNIVLVFNDVDVLPYKKGLLKYEPPPSGGTIMHHYGFEFALGGIFSILASDFEKLNGFGNYWSWGFEDNLIQSRAQQAGLRIDRSNFFPLQDMRILHINDGNKKSLNRTYMYELINDTGQNGINTIKNLDYSIDYVNNRVCVNCFETEYSPWTGTFEEYDLRNGRDLQAPLTKEMMLSNARLGKNLETLYFIDSNGNKQTMKELLRNEEEIQARERENEQQMQRTASLPRTLFGFSRASSRKYMQQATATHSEQPKPTSLGFNTNVMKGSMSKAMMSKIRNIEDRRNIDRQNDFQNQQRLHFQKRYGNFGLAVRH